MRRLLSAGSLRYVALVAVLAAVLATSSSVAGPAGSTESTGSRDLVASAQPTKAHPRVHHNASSLVWLPRHHGDADTVATASASCDGCRGHARAVQIVLGASADRVRVDNVATAWSSCVKCRSRALSVQVVLVRHPRKVVANNRALAVNAACTGCRTSAAAYQVVLVASGWNGTGALRGAVLDWVDGLTSGPGNARKGGGSTTRSSTAEGQLADLSRVVEKRTGGRVVDGSVDVDAGD